MQYFETKIFKRHSLSSHWLKTNGFYAQLYKKRQQENKAPQVEVARRGNIVELPASAGHSLLRQAEA